MNEYVTDDLLKAALTISADDALVDPLLDAARLAASRGIDAYCGRRFYLDGAVSQRVYMMNDRVVADADGDLLLVDDIGATAGLIVEIGNAVDGWTVVTSEVETEPENAAVRGRAITALRRPYWYRTSRATRVRVTAKWGWPAVPDEVSEAALIYATRLYKRKDSPEGVAGSAEWGVVRMSRTDPDVAALLSSYTVAGMG